MEKKFLMWKESPKMQRDRGKKKRHPKDLVISRSL